MSKKKQEVCPFCDEVYENVGQHWRWNPSHRPEFSQKQKGIIVGLLMGDGTLYRGNSTPYLRVKMINKQYLDYLKSKFGVFTTGVELEKTAEEAAKSVVDSGFYEEAEAKNYSNIYELRIRSHPQLSDYCSWYSSGTKVWPEDIELSPTTLKHWYCGDGTYNTYDGSRYISIGMANELGNTKKVDKYFERASLPKPSNYNTSNGTCIAEFTVDDTEFLFDYMGKPLPGFEYKWGQ